MHSKTFYSFLTVLAIVFTLAATASAAKKPSSSAKKNRYLLQYKFEMGEILRYRVEHSTNIRSTVESTSQQAESKSESIKAWKVTDVLPNGEMEFVHVVELVRMSNRVPNRATTKYDSERDKTPPPGFEQAARAVGVPLSLIRISPSGEIVKREEKHPQPPATDDMPITLQLPKKPLAVGQQWDATYDVTAERKSGAKLKVRTRRVCTLKQVKTGVATIFVEYQILTPVSAFTEAQLVERLSKGTVRFDIKRGRVISQKFKVDRRILGFAGGASSMHYRSHLEERILKPGEKLARKTKSQKRRKR
ncbi:MAG: hypothetical protein GXP26_16985 [Planctomycetes bacterium]|nr:hypothetical protein [Planctomycetota bacterium]